MNTNQDTKVKALIEQAGLEEVFALYPEDVLIAFKQAQQYNQTIKSLKIKKQVPGTTYTPGAIS
ncbi:hypothetical protein [Orrella sp. 11846]|uniref:hypothetical protein n=1 Tax=Orrella sp. 11846 TaxID=3409913 RepID=UPI003B58FB50